MAEEAVVVVAGGVPAPQEAAREVPPGTTVIAADGGLENAQALGLTATTAIGDFDSVSPAALEAAAAAGVQLVRHPEEKDATDLELALDAALALGPMRIHVLAGDGGRLDHLLAALLLLASPRYAAVPIDASFGPAHVYVVRGERTLAGEPGALLSLVALNGPAEGVTTEGLAYPLIGETLEPGSSRGVSNVFTAETARVRVDRGVLLAIRPGPEEQ
jgi:thiamine pyrophosphokinase